MKCHLSLVLCLAITALCSQNLRGQVITTAAGNGFNLYAGDNGPATAASINKSGEIALDAAGNVYFCDQLSNRVRKINVSTGIITTVAGNGTGDNNLHDGGPATDAHLHANWGIAFDAAGNLYITDQLNYRVRKVNTSGIITTFAGTGVQGYSGDGGPATNATFKRPMGIATDNLGNVYVGDQDSHNVRKISPSGIITTYAGKGTNFGYTGDGGPATDAEMSQIWGLAADETGNLYISDGGDVLYSGNSCIRKVSPSGIITTVAGTGTYGYSGDNGPATLARLNQPMGISVDNSRNLYIADIFNNRIRKVDTAGIIRTIAGTGAGGYNGEDIAATAAALNQPTSVVCGDSGRLYFVDFENFRVREYHKVLYFSRGRYQNYHICQDLSTQIDSFLAIRDQTTGKADTWSILYPPNHGVFSVNYSTISSGGQIVPSGLFYTPDIGYVGLDTMTVIVKNGVDSNLTTIFFNIDRRLDFAGAINGPSELCVGASVLLVADSSGGVWAASNLNAIVRGGLVTGQSAGNVTIKYTITNSCGSVFSRKDLTVYALPNAGKINGDSLYCIGDVAFLTDSVPGGTWIAKNNVVSISGTGFVIANSPGADTIVYTVDDGTCVNRATYPVSVIPFPTSQIGLAKDTICAGGAIAATGIPAGGQWQFANGNAILSNGMIVGVSSGYDIISYSYDNSCGIAVDSVKITVVPRPTMPVIVYNKNVISVASGYSVYEWLFNGAGIPDAAYDTFVVQNEGDYSVRVENQYGCDTTSLSLHYAACNVNEIEVYPNPSKSLLNVKWCNYLTVKILCTDGKCVELKIDNGVLDISDFPAGVYMLHLYDADGVKVKAMKIVKMDY